MILDLDNFKLVNDLYGHDMGDRVLVAFAGIVRINVRSDDVVCRIGGDEFMAFFADMEQEEAVESLTQRLNRQLMKEADSLMGNDHGIPLGISIGAVFVSEQTEDYQILFQYADNALYEAKRNGKHGCYIYDPDTASGNKEEDVDSELRRVTQVMSERNEGKGALLLGQEAFSWNYRFIERFLSRYGGTATRMLFSLSSEENGIIFSEMVSEFGSVLKDTLRKSDIIIQWQQSSFFAVLPLLTEKDTAKVIKRIMDNWAKTGYQDRMNIKYATSLLRKDIYEPEK